MYLFKDILELLKKAMRDAKMVQRSINDIMIIGGSTEIPNIQKELKDSFNGKEWNKDISPEKIVALESVFWIFKWLTLMASSHSLAFLSMGTSRLRRT